MPKYALKLYRIAKSEIIEPTCTTGLNLGFSKCKSGKSCTKKCTNHERKNDTRRSTFFSENLTALY